MGCPEPSRIGPRGASVVLTASLSPSVTSAANTAGSQIGCHLVSAKVFGGLFTPVNRSVHGTNFTVSRRARDTVIVGRVKCEF